MTTKFNSISEFTEYCKKLKTTIDNRIKIKVCITGCRAAGAIEVYEKFKQSISNNKDIKLIPTGCQKFCSGGPLIKVEFDTKEVFYQKVTVNDVERILQSVYKKQILDDLVVKDESFFKNQTFKVLKLCGEIDPLSIEDYIANGGFLSFLEVLQHYTSEKVINELKKSKLRGRGGAGFPTYLKWEIVKNQTSNEKFIICNGDEGDPGAFMDRTLLEGVPFQVIEGMLICGYTVGAKKGYFYIRAEYPIAVEHIKKALEICYNFGLCGKNILGTNFNFDIELKKGAGAFVCGEETALIASIEGKRGMPKPRPPFPAEKGLYGSPTCVNNVETFANIPIIINEGAENFAKLGDRKKWWHKDFLPCREN